MKNLFLCSCILLAACSAAAQQKKQTAPVEPPALIVLGKRQGDQNTLRWVANNYSNWQKVARGGVYVERYEIKNKGRRDNASRVLLTAQPFLPQPLDAWKARFGALDTVAGAAAQSLFGSAIPVAGTGQFDLIVALEQQQKMLYGLGMLLADWRPDLADAMALRMEDKNINKSATYLYRLFPAVPLSGGEADTAYCLVTPEEDWRAPSVYDLKAEELEHGVKLSWTDDGNLYPSSGYFIERSSDGGKTYKQLNIKPHIKIHTKESAELESDPSVFLDSLTANYKPYKYRVLGLNAFGETGKDGKVITAMGRDRTPPALPMTKEPAFERGKGLSLEWTIENPGDLKGFLVGHSNTADAQYTPLHNSLLTPGTRSFTDPIAESRGQINYYIVTAIDTAGNAMPSLPRHYHFFNTEPPAAPTGLKATIDTTGHLVLTWDPSKEPDFMGYNVFFANAADHEFIQLNGEPMKSDTLIHNLRLVTLTEEIFYKVVALDEAFNPSAFSQMLRVKKPDILPPSAPLIRNVDVTDNSIRLTWYASPSHDAAFTQLFRRKSGETEWLRVQELSQSVMTYTDTSIVIGQLYEYCLRAKDDDGLLSAYSTAHAGRAYPSPKGLGIQQFKAEKDKDKTQALLSWQLRKTAPARVFIYRAYNDGTMRLLQSTEAAAGTFSDAEVESGRTYRYAAKVVYDSGAESDMSNTVELVFE